MTDGPMEARQARRQRGVEKASENRSCLRRVTDSVLSNKCNVIVTVTVMRVKTLTAEIVGTVRLWAVETTSALARLLTLMVTLRFF